MKKLHIISIAVLLLSAGNAFASNSVNGTANATVIEPLIVTKTHDLFFGKIFSPSSIGFISVNASGTYPAGGLTASSIFSPGTRGEFGVTGEAGNTYSVTLSGTFGTDIVILQSGSDSMSASLNAKQEGGNPLIGGSGVFFVDGTLTVNASQPTGHYNSTYNLTVNYE